MAYFLCIVVLLLAALALVGCQSPGNPKMTVIAPAPTGDTPQPKWVKRGNVYYLQAGQALHP